MSEQTLWSGTSSQMKNFWIFVACLLVVPIPWALWAWLKTKNCIYTLTTERLMIRSGVLNKATESLELYRVRDLQVLEPFWARIFGLKNYHLITTDSTTPQLVLDFIPGSANLGDHLRTQIEAARQKKGVREFGIDFESAGEHSGDAQIS